MDKKGMAPTQIFTYILSMIFAVMVLMWGYEAISNITEQGDLMLKKKFQDRLVNAIDKMQHTEDMEQIKLSAPKGITGVCFVAEDATSSITGHPIIANYYGDKPSSRKENVFLMGTAGVAQYALKAAPLKVVEEGPSSETQQTVGCIDADGSRLIFEAEGAGKKVKIIT